LPLREAYPVLHFTLVKCQFHFSLPLTAYSSHHSLQIDIFVIQTRQWMDVLCGYRSCEGLKATHLSRDKDDQREYYLQCLLVISTRSGLYWVLLNWGDADCHQTPGAFRNQVVMQGTVCTVQEKHRLFAFHSERRGEELSAFSQILSSSISGCLKNTERIDATSNFFFTVFF